MKVSRKWLATLVDLEGISTKSLADGLTNAGFEVEAIDTLVQGDHLVVGYIESCIEHPDSDHLHVCQVNIGASTLQIVCGAPNVASGQKVIVALDGAQLPGGIIRNSVIRGQQSNGMICSMLELGLAEKYVSEASKTGIEILPDDATLGADPIQVMGLDDEILDVSLTPNRADFMAMFSVANEVAAIFDRTVKLPEYAGAAQGGLPTKLQIHSQTVKNSGFIGKVINHVTLRPSPQWIREALIGSGVKPINNVVDISNIVMLELGQPLHFYDKDFLATQEITVKTGLDQDVIALDGLSYHLDPEDVVITSANQPVGIAGVMGLGNSMIKAQTQGIIIEVASFDPVAIRHTAKRLNLMTEASIRYSKPMDSLAPQKAIDRAVYLLKMYADATDCEENYAIQRFDYSPIKVTISVDKINAVLGTSIDTQTIVDIFRRLNFQPQLLDEQFIATTIPSYRQDIHIAEDLIEEVIRIYGYDKITSSLPLLPQTVGQLTLAQTRKRLIETTLVGLGVNQVVTYTLVNEKATQGNFALSDPYPLLAPMSEERSMIRNQLMMSEVEMLAYNNAHKNTDATYFEISNVYGHEQSDQRLAIIGNGLFSATPWLKQQITMDFYAMKGLLMAVLNRLGYQNARIDVIANDQDIENYHPNRSAQLCVDHKVIGYFGELHPSLAKDYKVKGAVYGEISLNALFTLTAQSVRFKAIAKYPEVKRDLAIVVDADLAAAQLEQVIRTNGKPFLKQVEVFDRFADPTLGLGKKSLAFALTFASGEATLTDVQINESMKQIIAALQKRYNATLR